jgi:hypothetical protein
MYEGRIEISNYNLPDIFAIFFNSKVKNIVTKIEIDEHGYNGNTKVDSKNAINIYVCVCVKISY